ncbi:MAG: helix-hairpin-helix domain-containing protein [Gaiellaceae bacterium]
MTSSFPFTRRQALAGAVALLVVLALGGRLLARPGGTADALPVEPVAVAEATERASPEQVVVHVVGAVRSPGLYRLDDGSRVADALALAGGTTRKADLTAVNLAALLLDGTQIVVPKVGPGPAAASGTDASGAPAGPIRLNSATVEELQEIPGVGPVTAQQIVAFREQNGPFRSVDELDAVPGIGPKRLEQMRELVVP